MQIPTTRDLADELTVITSRSSGPGGQNVNKVNSKVSLRFDVANSVVLDPMQKALIISKLATKLSKEGILLLSAQDSRSQSQNKEEVFRKLDELLVRVLTPKKVRRATRPGKAVARKRMDQKRRHSEKKQWRKKP